MRQKSPAMWVRVEGDTKNSKRDTIKVFNPSVKRKKKTMAQSLIVDHTQSITLCSPPSIDEKSSILNIEVVYTSPHIKKHYIIVV